MQKRFVTVKLSYAAFQPLLLVEGGLVFFIQIDPYIGELFV
jgi:hypothetical protein